VRQLWVLGISVAAACAAQPPAEAPTEEPPVVIQEDTILGYTDASTPVAVTDAGTDAPATDWKAELEWARSEYPTMKEYHTESPVSALLDWVPLDKSVTLYASLQKLRCKPATATRKADEKFLSLEVITKDVAKVQEYTDAQAGDVLRYGFGGGKRKLNADGTVDELGAWGASDTGNEGVLSSVEGDIARFDGQWVRPDASCGPIEQLPCAEGGTRECNRCTQVAIAFQVVAMGVIRQGAKFAISSCKEPCPKADNPGYDRLLRLLAEEDSGWRLTTEGPPARLYRTLAACQADRPKRGK
jgi:hypothetical protein